MIFSMQILFILIAIALACSIGFKKYIWFISIGYGLSIAVIGIMLLLVFIKILNLGFILASLVLIFYGLRLSIFLALREFKSLTYMKKMKNEISDGKNMKFFVKIMIWISSVFLYFMMCSSIIYRFVNNKNGDILFYIGIIIAICGILIELIADAQKNNQKKTNPNRFCDKGLYKIVRCPNYLGEIIVWLGVFISGITSFSSKGQLIIALIGLVGILFVMFSGTRRIELRQDKCYSQDEEYIKYKKSTPILIPFIPLYSVKKFKWLVA